MSEHRARPAEGHRSTLVTIVVALAANLVIAVAKAVAGLIASSPAMLSEAAHSVADSLNEVFLIASLRRSKRAPDREHPFGYGKERFFWSLLAAVGIFVTGGCFSFFQGLQAWRHSEAETHTGYLVSFAVLGFSLLAESTSLARALFQAPEVRTGQGLSSLLRAAGDPAVRTVLAEDATALAGVLLAAAGLGLHALTGDSRWEAGASLAIGLLLVFVAYRLGRQAEHELIGQAADPHLQGELRAFLHREADVDTVAELLTMQLGPDSTLLAARLDIHPGRDSEEVEEICMRIREAMRKRWPQLDHVFLDITDASPEQRSRAEGELKRLPGGLTRPSSTSEVR
ncbi:cation diffusion facilitator family transporter [Streptacidiphilus cavernicola]|uniref:Cation diffusion facilitator family transporter n=1 Tax=Streptacidiphilus cavernicola TaxID=3342716 RepID=A0ABV6VQ17_9ACTN